MHFRTGCEQGLRQGERVARFAFRHYLRIPHGKAWEVHGSGVN
jgi:hypothetical protein